MSWNIKTPGDYINGPLTVIGNVGLGVAPSGTNKLAVNGTVATYNKSAYIIYSDSGSTYIGGIGNGGSIFGSGTDNDIGITTGGVTNLRLGTNNTERVRIDSYGQVGIGQTPFAWRSVYRVVDLGARSAIANNPDSVSTDIFHNIYIDSGGSAIHKALGAAAFLRLEGNVYKFLAAPSASAGAVASLTTPLLINANAAIVLKDGNASANGIGIAFPAAQSASTDANTLDDYEEGTWTGTIKGSVSDPTVAFTATGHYTKIGRVVNVRINFSGSTAGASGNVFISGLPFGSAQETPGSVMAGSALTFTGFAVSYITAGSSNVQFYATQSSGILTDVTHNAGTSRSLWISITYIV